MRPETCTHDGCGAEVRWGWRDGQKGWWHQAPVDHQPIFGHRFTADDAAEVERQLDLPRERLKPTKTDFPLLFEIETYTAREDRLKAMKKAKRNQLLEEGLDEEEIERLHQVDIPEPEVRKTPIERADPRCVQGAKNLMNAAAKAGWEVRRLTYSRGPYLGAAGQVLSISDFVVVGVVDTDHRCGVASWRDGKVIAAWYGERVASLDGPDRVRMELTTITDLKTKMKGAA